MQAISQRTHDKNISACKYAALLTISTSARAERVLQKGDLEMPRAIKYPYKEELLIYSPYKHESKTATTPLCM